MVKAHRNGLRPPLRGDIVPVEDADGVEAAENTEGVLVLAAKGGEIADKFGTFCRKFLCQESWDFIVDATHYQNMVHKNQPFARSYTTYSIIGLLHSNILPM